jgi:hypothetical protein|tara:strand:- start:102 stop:713 length:612 start_codon:yes stop_codon:yes gene_type:complete
MQEKLNYVLILTLILMSVSCKNEKKNDTLNSKTESEFNTDFYSEVGACPFEGCLYGEWTTIGEIKIFKEPNLESNIVGEIPADKKFNSLNGKIEIVPGIAFKVKDLPTIGYTDSETTEINYNQPIYILHYVGEGFYKVNQNNKFHFLQLPSDKKIFNEYKSDFDWIRIEKYPMEFKWWAEIEYLDLKGWILVNDKVVPLDKYG